MDHLYPQGWRWRVDGERPPITMALPFGLACRKALGVAARRQGMERLPDFFHGPVAGAEAHRHAHWLAEDADGDGLIDHMLVFAEAGLSPPLVRALASAALPRSHEWGATSLEPQWMGARGPGGLFGPARSWRGLTPYVTPRWRTREGVERKRDHPEAQLLGELEKRGWPRPVNLAFFPIRETEYGDLASHAFLLERERRRPPGDAVAAFLALDFDEPVWGPAAFGYGAHFGLGLLAPVVE